MSPQVAHWVLFRSHSARTESLLVQILLYRMLSDQRLHNQWRLSLTHLWKSCSKICRLCRCFSSKKPLYMSVNGSPFLRKQCAWIYALISYEFRFCGIKHPPSDTHVAHVKKFQVNSSASINKDKDDYEQMIRDTTYVWFEYFSRNFILAWMIPEQPFVGNQRQ